MPQQQQQQQVALSKSEGGCFSRLFRLLLCAHSTNTPPIHPSDHLPPTLTPQTLPSILSSLPNKPNNTNNPIIPSTAPGLVARLMGLDSLPNTSRVSIRVKQPDSVTRSKSVNFIDYLLKFDPSYHQEQERIHRRVRTSSFREVPTAASFPPEKNDGGGGSDVVVLLWDDADKKAARESRRREVEKVVGERWRKLEDVGGLRESRKLQRRRDKKKRKISKLRNEPRRRVVSASTRTRDCGYGGNLSPRMMRKEEFVEPTFRKKLRSNNSSKKMKNEGCYENLSPVSALDVGEEDDFPRKKKDIFTDETKGMDLKSKRESSRERGNKSNVHKSETEEFSELMSNLRKLAENDVLLQMFDCVGRKGVFGSDCFDEISLLLEHKIFDLLLREVVHELLTL